MFAPASGFRLALVAGERSGDMLGARVLRALRRALPEASIHVEGIGGESLIAEGLESLCDMERLSVMGLIEPLGRLPELLRLRARLRQRWLSAPPDLFLGIDAPDFNLGLAGALRRGGVATAQLVSPTVWAWRPGRIHKVARAVDDLLCLFPFEPACYADVDLRAHYVGHPLAAELAEEGDRGEARRRLGLDEDAPVIALLPGSRAAEVTQLAATLLRAGLLLRERDSRRQLLMPAASSERFEQCRALLSAEPGGDHVRLLRGQSRDAMVAADVVILASGTATLEAMLLRRPMVIAYRVAPLSWTLMSRMAVTRFVGLPNILAGEAVVPELLQDGLSAPALAIEAETLLGPGGRAQVAALEPGRQALAFDFDAAAGKCLADALLHSRQRRGPRAQS
ncbi:MAG: lipid-A-disaccharide synthase [Halieaceae bacterium]|nr:lipid-A-disaccharide synthase [Halieaceae bacterium]